MKHHKISLLTAILMNINIMVGSGILAGPAVMAAISGNASFLGWLVVALLFLPIVLSLVQLSRMCPGSGGFYAYAKEGLNKTAGFWSGWLYIVGYTFAVTVEVFVLRKTLLVSLGHNALTSNPIVFNFVAVAACVLINMLSIRMFSRILNSLTISKVIPLITLILIIPFIFNPSFTISTTELSLLPYSLPMAIFGYFGFEYCCSISHLIEDSERNAPKAILIGFFATALIYALFHFGLLNLMGSADLSRYGAAAFADFITLPIPYIKTILKFLIPLASAITLFGAAAGLLNANAVMLHAMAEERLIFGWPLLSQMTSWYRPWVTICLQGVIVFLLVSLFPNINIIGNLCNVGVILSFILPLVSLITLQRRMGNAHKIPLTVIAIIVAVGLSIYSIYALADTTSERLMNLLPLVAFMILGALLMQKDSTLKA